MNVAGNACVSKNGSTPVTLCAAALALPEMDGPGVVRHLREAMSLGSSAAAGLTSAVQVFVGATTRDAQRAMLDELLRQWAGTEAIADRFRVEPVGLEARQFVVNGSGDAALPAQLARVIPVLEAFTRATADQSSWVPVVSIENGLTIRSFTIASQRATPMLAGCGDLRESVYSVLVVHR